MTKSARVALQLNECSRWHQAAKNKQCRKMFSRVLPHTMRGAIANARLCLEVARAINAEKI
jgi:hypothetical protein